MSSKKEIGFKNRNKVLSLILAPSIPTEHINKSVQFISEDENKVINFIYDKNHEIQFFRHEGGFLPSIKFIRENPTIDFPIVKVDQGAVTHILNGADVFTQGISELNRDFDANSIVLIANPQNSILSVGKSLKSSLELLNAKGKGVINLHYLGDAIWSGKT